MCRHRAKTNVIEHVRTVEQLNDFEEMMISLARPLVQVYTISSTGELVFDRCVRNFREPVQQWVSNLPVRPADMPFVLMKPRMSRASKDQKARPPVPIDTRKVKRAFYFLKENNPYYFDIEWGQNNEAAWGDEELPTREETITSHLSVDQLVFEEWVGQENLMVFETAASLDHADLKAPEFASSVAQAKMLVIDEISIVGAAQLEMISRRLEPAAKFRNLEMCESEPPDFFSVASWWRLWTDSACASREPREVYAPAKDSGATRKTKNHKC